MAANWSRFARQTHSDHSILVISTLYIRLGEFFNSLQIAVVPQSFVRHNNYYKSLFVRKMSINAVTKVRFMRTTTAQLPLKTAQYGRPMGFGFWWADGRTPILHDLFFSTSGERQPLTMQIWIRCSFEVACPKYQKRKYFGGKCNQNFDWSSPVALEKIVPAASAPGALCRHFQAWLPYFYNRFK